MSGGRADSGVKVDQAVVGSVRTGCRGDADSGLGGETDVGGGGYGQEGDGLSLWEYNVAHITLGMDHNTPHAYAPVL